MADASREGAGALQPDPVTQSAELAAQLARARALARTIPEAELAIGQTPKDRVYRDGHVSLYRYRPLVDAPRSPPVLIVYALVGRYTIIDLQEDRSLVRKLLEQGLDVYAVDWGHPSRAQMWTTLDDYVNGYLADCVAFIARDRGVPAVDLLGICQGGIFNLCYAALDPRRVRKLVTCVAPIDFHADVGDPRTDRGFVHVWTRACEGGDIDLLVDGLGNLSGEMMAHAFGLMNPVSHHAKHGLGLLDVAGDRRKLVNYLRMERWLADRPAHTAESARQWLKDFYQDNKLVKGELVLGERRVDLARVTMPVLNIFGEHDQIAPPATSRALGAVVRSDDYTELEFPGGHIGLFVGARAQGMLAPAIAEWLAKPVQV